MFKLFELSVSLFAVVKADEDTSRLPITAHGFIQVSDLSAILPDFKWPAASLIDLKMSEELKESGELESLKEQALELSKEAVADEFSTD